MSTPTAKQLTSPAAPRAAVYTRISEDREGREIGVERQMIDSRVLAARRGLEIVGEYSDNDISASTASTTPRPGYDAMIAAVRAGEVDVVVAYSSSRITRRPREWEDLIELNEATGFLIFTAVGGDIDLATAAGRRMARINYAVGAGEAEEIRERIHRANQHRVEVLGEPTNGIRYGWRRGRGGAMELDPEHAEVVREIARRVVAGESLSRIKNDLNARAIPTPRVDEIARRAEQGKTSDQTSRGVPNAVAQEIAARTVAGEPLTAIVADLHARRERVPAWSHASLRSVVMRPANVARIAYQGQMFPGKFPPILDVETFEAVCVILGDEARAPRRPEGMRYREIRHVLSGVAVCGKPDPNGVFVLSDGTRVCGSAMRVTTQGSGRASARPYRPESSGQSYTCKRCFGASCRTYQAEAWVRDLVLEWLARPNAADLLAGDPAAVREQEARITALTERRRKVARAYGDGAYDDDEYAKRLRAIDGDLNEAKVRRQAAGPVPELARWVSGDAEETWQAADPGERRDLIAALMTVVILPGGRGRKGFDGNARIRLEWRA